MNKQKKKLLKKIHDQIKEKKDELILLSSNTQNYLNNGGYDEIPYLIDDVKKSPFI